MAIEIAEAVVGALKGELAATAVNAPMVPAEVLSELSSPICCSVMGNMINHVACMYQCQKQFSCISFCT